MKTLTPAKTITSVQLATLWPFFQFSTRIACTVSNIESAIMSMFSPYTEKVTNMQAMLADIFRPYCGHFVGQNNSSVINQVKQTIHNIVDILIQYIRLDDRMTSMLQ